MNSKTILGIDEVGRGPWAGPLVVGAVILGDDFPADIRESLTDSKKLSAKRRETLSSAVLEHAPATGLGWVTASEIDRYGLSPALKLAARRAVKQVLQAKIPFDEIVIDGTINLLSDTPLNGRVTLLKKADALVKEVSAASIIAKVARDRYMYELATKYPGYGFEQHVGYGTAAHQSALLDLGPCPEHRRSFRPIRALLQGSPAERQISTLESASATLTAPSLNKISPLKSTEAHKNTTLTGQTAEAAVLDFLLAKGHQPIAQNFKTKLYEIDLITTFEQKIYFTEVKYRRSSSHGTPLDSITTEKQRQITFAATSFLATHPEFRPFEPRLAVASVTSPDYHVETWFPLDAGLAEDHS